ncbi:Tumor suppressor candidate 2 [Nymphon striatum]|nr:Tumor suppressor candidate 2 [Nymphon striatum]
MGGFGSKAAKKVFSPFCGDQNIPTSSELSKFQGVKLASPFVLTRKGSMFFDEDGELAHEFYEEVFSKKRKRNYLKRINTNLTPQVQGYGRSEKNNEAAGGNGEKDLGIVIDTS